MPGLLHEWLGRSGALPLTVYFHTDFGREPLYSDIKAQNALQAAIGSAIDTLNLHSGRWRSLHITASSDAIKRLSCPTILDQLTSLELVITDFSSPADFMTESELNVTHLKLICFPLTSINVRWDMVTHATISEVVLNEALELLRRASNLQYYCVSLSGRRETDPVIPVVNPQLRSLDLWGPHFGTLLSEITLPSLEEWTQDMSRGRPLETMQSFVERSRCRIKMLNLSSPVLVSRALHPLLQKLPSVERIRLHFWITETDEDASIDDILIRIFVSGPENRTPEPFLPHLQLLEWKSSGSPPLSWDLLPIFYSKNNRRSLKLKTFAHESQITNKDAFELLRLEEKEGLDLQIIDEATGEDVLEPWRIGILEASV
ncbi:hypothetical protein M413DRAFT_31789 [Hebeloma cylindrosporum]|uniref:F-box domain-containing protein n=1 Tax=Hebeloma cylindrosporum TaxID=76867 RepID=A0A0C3BI25_HEBCY|nr:hypothetical protein M413DRAFT_31789 [Hebeloma cylindrosporum h7]